MQNEFNLLSRARALDEAALEEIHDTYYGPIFRYVVYRVSDQQAAQDLTGEVFVRLLSALRDKSAPQKTLRGWLYGVASHVVNDYHRKQYRMDRVELHESLPSNSAGPAARVASNLRWQQVKAALPLLTDAQREVLALRFGQELPIREAARLMGKSEGAVKQLQARALAALSRHLRNEEDEQRV